MGGIASQITSLTIVYSTVYPDADQRKHQSSASLAFVRGIEFPAQMSSNAENVSIWWRHHELSLFHGPHTFACGWLAQDHWVTSQEERWALLIHTVYAIAMVADTPANNGRAKAISNHHADLIMHILRVTGIVVHPLNKQFSRELGCRPSVNFFVIDGFAF